MGKIYQVMVHGLRDEKLLIDLCNTEEQMKSMTVLQLKEKISEKLPDNAGEDALRLVFTDKPLDEDHKPLSEYGIQHMSVIHMILKVPGGEAVLSGGCGQRTSAALPSSLPVSVTAC
ncbi:NEDD8-like isoform X1 [Salarias fasciatus]|uniref:NEDD8-like isoform X1 n=1 Tax=Salarias fasciatus TaxID=181472 RepID=UPI001176C54F|nr:NEDD8-like isoform X1 [Salarias fasciatus]